MAKDLDSKDKQPGSGNECDASCEKGRHDATSITNQHARGIPPLTNQQIDKGDNILNPMADKLEGIKRETKSLDETGNK
jgi:hypothetical protein